MLWQRALLFDSGAHGDGVFFGKMLDFVVFGVGLTNLASKVIFLLSILLRFDEWMT